MTTAQEEWKSIWRIRKDWQYPRHWQKKVRREAALERIIARQEREIERVRLAERNECAKVALLIATKQYDNEQAVQIYDDILSRT